MNAGLAPLTSFILPGGSEAPARVHIARAAVAGPSAARLRRRAGAVNPAALDYLNRLSDYLFVMARGSTPAARATCSGCPGASLGIM